MARFKVTTNQRVLYVENDTEMHVKELLNFGTRDGFGGGYGGTIRWQQGETIETVEEES